MRDQTFRKNSTVNKQTRLYNYDTNTNFRIKAHELKSKLEGNTFGYSTKLYN